MLIRINERKKNNSKIEKQKNSCVVLFFINSTALELQINLNKKKMLCFGVTYLHCVLKKQMNENKKFENQKLKTKYVWQWHKALKLHYNCFKKNIDKSILVTKKKIKILIYFCVAPKQPFAPFPFASFIINI